VRRPGATALLILQHARHEHKIVVLSVYKRLTNTALSMPFEARKSFHSSKNVTASSDKFGPGLRQLLTSLSVISSQIRLPNLVLHFPITVSSMFLPQNGKMEFLTLSQLRLRSVRSNLRSTKIVTRFYHELMTS
jgi:hypothetical protein